MNVLVIAHDLPPALNPQSVQIGRLIYHLAQSHTLYVATSSYKTPHACRAYAEWPQRVHDSLSVKSIHALPGLGLYMRLVPFLFRIPEPSRLDMPSLKRAIAARWGNVRFDRLLSFAYPFSSHLLGMDLKDRFGCPWTAHFSDPWTSNPLMNYGPVSRPLNKRWEEKVIAAADQVIWVSPETRDYYAERYPAQAAKMKVLEHSFDPALYQAAPPPPPGRPFTIRFLGNLYGGRRFDTFFKALARAAHEAKGERPFQVELVLSYPRPLSKLIRDYQLETIVHIKPPVDYLDSLQLMREADLLVTIETPLPPDFKRNVFYPSKLADYMGSRRPILALAGAGASKRIVKSYGGWTADPDDDHAIAEVLGQILGRWRRGELQRFIPVEAAMEAASVDTQARRLSGWLS